MSLFQAFPGILCDDTRVRNLAVKAIGLCSFINLSFAKKYLALFLQVLSKDTECVRVTALTCLFDFLIEHGIDSFVVSDQDANESMANREANKEIEREAGVEEDGEESDSDERGELTLDKFIDLLTNLIDAQFESDSPVIRYHAVEGVAKMLSLGKIYSPRLLTKLIMIWYNDEVEQKTKHFIGVFLPFFAFSDKTRASAGSGQSTFEDCYLDTIKTAYVNSKKAPEEIENVHCEPQMPPSMIDNMITYLSTLLDEHTKVRVFENALDELLAIIAQEDINEEDIELARFYLKALTDLDLYAANSDQAARLKNKLEKAKSEMESSGEFPNAYTKKIAKILER